MAGEWLKFECSLPEKPETLAITVAMGWDDPDLTVGKLMRLFRWFDQHTVDGNAKGVTPALLDRLIGVTGFVQAMADSGWIEIETDGLSLHNFDKHNGQSAKSRGETAKRVANHRARKAGETDADYQRLCIPRPIRAAVLSRDGNACVYCSRKEGEYGPTETKRDGYMHLDHVIPLTHGGSNDISNLVTACGPCNQFKSDRTPDECGLTWPEIDGKRAGNSVRVTQPLAREEKKREENKEYKAQAPLPDWLPQEPWAGYVEMRKRIRKPMTARAEKLILNSLSAMHERGISVAAALDNSTKSNWVDVYEPKPGAAKSDSLGAFV